MRSTIGTYYLGRVKRAPYPRDNYHYATLEPLVESDSDGRGWIGLVSAAESRFPQRGLIHWHDAPAGIQIGSIWQFCVDEQPFTDRADRLEHYQLSDPSEPIEVINLRGWSDEALLRSTMTGDGFELSSPPVVRRVLLWLASGLCAGPLLLKKGEEEGRFVVDTPDAHRDSGRMPLWDVAEADINEVELEGRRWFLSPRAELERSAGIQNWSSDIQVARSVLARLRKMDPELVKALKVTDNIFREYLDHVERGRFGSADPATERARADRLRGIVAAIQHDTKLFSEAVETLLAIDPLYTDVRARADKKVDELIEEAHSDINKALAAANEQLKQLMLDVVGKQNELAELDDALIEKAHELDQKVASFDREMTERLEEIARRPESFFAEAATLKAVLAPIVRRSAPKGETILDGLSNIDVSTQRRTELNDAAEVRAALAAAALGNGLSLYSMLALHSTFAAGRVPVVLGERGYDLLRAYTSVIAGGRLLWLPVSASVMQPQDVLGRFDIMSGRILPDAGGLLDVLTDANATERLHVVTLAGFNRAPCEAYLSPILEVAAAGRSGDKTRTIPIAHPAIISDTDPYGELARLVWPFSVLIACLPTDGTVALPVSASVLKFISMIDADDRDRGAIHSESQVVNATEVGSALWNALAACSDDCAWSDLDKVRALGRTLKLPPRFAESAARVGHILSANGLPPADALALAVTTTLIPSTTVGRKAVEEGMRSIGVDIPGWQTILDEAERLRG